MRFEMTAVSHRQRFRSILQGNIPDQTEWAPRLDIWYAANRSRGTLPPELEGLSLAEAEAFLGMAHSARKASVFTIEYENVEHVAKDDGDTVRDEFHTPEGSVACVYRYPPQARASGIAPIMWEPYIKRTQDYGVLEYVACHTRYLPAYETYLEYDGQVGERGMPLVILHESPIHAIMLKCLGYERFYGQLFEDSARIEALLDAMTHSYRRMWRVVMDSPAEFVLHGVHFSSDMTPPPIFERYFLPYFSEFNEAMHKSGKKVAFHCDADVSLLLDLILQCNFDVADTFACAPLVRCTFDAARAAWGDHIVIWGGVPSIILEPSYPRDKFEQYVKDLHGKTTGAACFIMGVSDNIMPDAEFERLLWIRDFLMACPG